MSRSGHLKFDAVSLMRQVLNHEIGPQVCSMVVRGPERSLSPMKARYGPESEVSGGIELLLRTDPSNATKDHALMLTIDRGAGDGVSPVTELQRCSCVERLRSSACDTAKGTLVWLSRKTN
jgi:hypothetical protein